MLVASLVMSAVTLSSNFALLAGVQQTSHHHDVEDDDEGMIITTSEFNLLTDLNDDRQNGTMSEEVTDYESRTDVTSSDEHKQETNSSIAEDPENKLISNDDTRGGGSALTTNSITSTSTKETIHSHLQRRAREILMNEQSAKPPNTLGAFIHLGKTGGSSLSTLLNNGCHSWVPKPCRDDLAHASFDMKHETILSKLTTYYHTPDFSNKVMFHNLKSNIHEFIVITVRDPFERMVSKYVYSHPALLIVNKFEAFKKTAQFTIQMRKLGSEAAVYAFREAKIQDKHREIFDVYECFPTLEAFAMLLDDVLDHKAEHWRDSMKRGDCANVAKLAVNPFAIDDAGFETLLTHFHWNLVSMYQSHAGIDAYPTMALRTEHLNTDWIASNRYLGQDGDVLSPVKKLRDTSSTIQSSVVSKDLSKEGRKKVCIALKDEYNYYLSIIWNSINLKQDEKLESLEYSRKNCPWLDLSFPIKKTHEDDTS